MKGAGNKGAGSKDQEKDNKQMALRLAAQKRAHKAIIVLSSALDKLDGSTCAPEYKLAQLDSLVADAVQKCVYPRRPPRSC